MSARKKSKKVERKPLFLIVLEDAEEVKTALKFACRRAKKVGAHISLLSIVEQHQFQDWMGVSKMMQEERRAEAEKAVSKWADIVRALMDDEMPELIVREGPAKEAVTKAIEEDPTISMLVLGAAPDSDSPGALVSHFAGKMSGKLRIPVMIVPGGLSDEDIEKLA